MLLIPESPSSSHLSTIYFWIICYLICLCIRREPLLLLSLLQILPTRRRFTALWRTETFRQWWNCNRGRLFHGALALKCTNFLNLRLVPSWVTNLVLKSLSGPLLLLLTCFAWKSYVSLCFQSLISTHTLILKCNIYWRCQVFPRPVLIRMC